QTCALPISHYFADQRSAEENLLARPFDLAVPAHPAWLVVRGIDRILKTRRIAQQRCRVTLLRRGLTQGFMRALAIELLAKTLEARLLLRQVGGRRSGGFGPQRLVHPLMASVLLRLARLDALRRDAELDPPYPEPTQPTRAERGKRRRVFGRDPTP